MEYVVYVEFFIYYLLFWYVNYLEPEYFVRYVHRIGEYLTVSLQNDVIYIQASRIYGKTRISITISSVICLANVFLSSMTELLKEFWVCS